jgi:hypothetical protein
MAAVIGQAAMSVSCAGAEAHGNGSARMRAGARWNACGNENGAGEDGAPGAATVLEDDHGRGSREHVCHR